MCVATNEENEGLAGPTAVQDNSQTEVSSQPINVKENETVKLYSAKESYGVGIDNDLSYFDSGVPNNVPLAKALERPVRLQGVQGANDLITWVVGTNNDNSFDPWILWQSDPFIKDKLSNFAYLRCNLVVRFVPACNPFQYGRLMINYIPFGSANEIWNNNFSILRTGGADGCRSAYQQYVSTYPITGFIHAEENNVVELKLPFIWYKNYIPIAGKGGDDKVTLGRVAYTDINHLRVANPDAKNSAQIAVWCHAEDIEVHVPTDIEPTSGKSKRKGKIRTVRVTGNNKQDSEIEEAASGTISGPASAVQGIADRLTDVPVIGSFAKATSIAAGAVGGIARLFGFSNPPMIASPDPMSLRLYRNLATTVGGDSAIPLSIDPKQELTIDPRVIGISGTDDMSIPAMITREQWLTKGKWLAGSGQFATVGLEKVIVASIVNPNQLRTTDVFSLQTATQMCPGGYVGRCFRYWRGSITYRIEVVASKYHSGTLQIQFDPFRKSAALTNAEIVTDEVNTRQTVIMDISECRDLEFTIDYVSDEVMLETRDNSQGTFQPKWVMDTAFGLTANFNPYKDLGMLIVSVVNELTAPGPTDVDTDTGASCEVNLWMKCEENMVFGQPISGFEDDIFIPTSFYDWGDDDDEFVPTSLIEWSETKLVEASDNKDTLTCIGERVENIRTLLKRATIVELNTATTAASSNSAQIVNLYFPHFAPENLAGATNRRNCYESYFSPAFLAKRGSMRWKVYVSDVINTGFVGVLTVQRASSQTTVVGASTASGTITGSGIINDWPSGVDGMDVTECQYKPVVDYQMPFYSNTRFNLACSITNMSAAKSITKNPTMNEILYSRVTYEGINAQRWLYMAHASVGEDYALLMFQAPPTIWITP